MKTLALKGDSQELFLRRFNLLLVSLLGHENRGKTLRIVNCVALALHESNENLTFCLVLYRLLDKDS